MTLFLNIEYIPSRDYLIRKIKRKDKIIQKKSPKVRPLSFPLNYLVISLDNYI